MKTVFLQEIENPKEREVLKLLKEKGPCLYGDIFKQLGISPTEGQQVIMHLLSREFIRYQYRSSVIELNVGLR